MTAAKLRHDRAVATLARADAKRHSGTNASMARAGVGPETGELSPAHIPLQGNSRLMIRRDVDRTSIECQVPKNQRAPEQNDRPIVDQPITAKQLHVQPITTSCGGTRIHADGDVT